MKKILLLAVVILGIGFTAKAQNKPTSPVVMPQNAHNFDLCAQPGQRCFRYNAANWLWLSTVYEGNALKICLYDYDKVGNRTNEQCMTFIKSEGDWHIPENTEAISVTVFMEKFSKRFQGN